jgi:hypothetical protein
VKFFTTLSQLAPKNFHILKHHFLYSLERRGQNEENKTKFVDRACFIFENKTKFVDGACFILSMKPQHPAF